MEKPKRGKLGLIATIVLPLLVIGFVLGPVLWNRYQTARLLEHGVAATASVLEIIDTGDRMNKNPVVRVRLTVRGADGTEFPAEVETVASAVRLQTLKPGARLVVRYDAAHRERVAIDDRVDTPPVP